MLTAVTAAVWLVLAGPAYLVGQTRALEGLSYSAILCLIPGWVAVWISALFSGNHSQAAMSFLVGSTLRLMFVLAGTMAIRSLRPQLGLQNFVVWLLLFYLAMLLTETLMMLKQKPAAANQTGEMSLESTKKVN